MKQRQVKKVLKKMGINPEIAFSIVAEELVQRGYEDAYFIDVCNSWPYLNLHSCDGIIYTSKVDYRGNKS